MKKKFMATQARLESSLRRSASLGLEVLERASRRSVDWTSVDATPASTPMEEFSHTPRKKSRSDLDEAFASIAELMAQTTCHCRKFYGSGSCSEPSDAERNHVSRFHRGPAVEKKTPPLSASTHTGPGTPPPPPGGAPAPREDFYIEVSPGSYAVTASLAESQQQTHLVSLSPGETVDLTFNL